MAVSWPGTLYIHFRDNLPPDGILPRAKFTFCPSMRHRTSVLGYIFATKASIDNLTKSLLSSNMSYRCPHNMVNFGILTAEIVWRVWGTPSYFNGFRVLSFFFSSPNLSGQRLDVYHTSTHGVALVRIWNACLKCAVRCSLKIQDAKNRHFGTIAQLCRAVSSQLSYVLTIVKKLVKHRYLRHVSS